MKLIITQPNYLPWLGYFAQLESCDAWVVLDDVQYARREWQNRNRILSINSKPYFLSLPLQKAERSAHINKILLSNTYSPDEHLSRIKSSYLKAPYFESVFSFVQDILFESFDSSNGYLSDLNISLICLACKNLGIDFKIYRSSTIREILPYQTATEKLLSIAKHFGATSYLSSAGAKAYMSPELHLFKEASIQLLWQDFTCTPYSQIHSPNSFVSHLCFIDYLFNCGFSDFKSHLKLSHKEIITF